MFDYNKMFNVDKNFFASTDFNADPVLGLLQTTAQDYAGKCNTLKEVAEHTKDYKYIYRKDAERALQNAGVFDCFQVVHDYLMEVLGEDKTNYYNPVDVANLLFFIQVKKVTQAVAAWIGVDLDDDLDPENWNKLLCADVKNLIPFLELEDFHSFKEHV